eukprot:7573649-Heterocapsa_arctica.AAC.1
MQFFQEARAKESRKGPGGETDIPEEAGAGHGSGPSHGRGTERASGSMDRMNFGEEEEAGTGRAAGRGPTGDEEVNQPPDQGSRKRSRSTDVEE